MELRLKEEVPVVSKEAHVVEEIKLSKDETIEDATVRETARESKMDIDENRDTDNRGR